MPKKPIPYYWSSVDWAKLVDEFPPPPFFDEVMADTSDDALLELQNARFLARMKDAWSVPFYRNRWSAVGLEPGDIRGLDDLEKIPTFTSDDIKTSIEAHPPFGDHQNFALETMTAPLKIQSSGGTSGLPRPTLFDPVAWEVQAIQFARAFVAQGSEVGDILQITLTNSLGNTAWCSSTAAQHWSGLVPLTTGSGAVTSSVRQLELAREWGTAGWVAFGEYMKILAETAKTAGIDLKKELPTRFIHTYLGVDTEGHLRKLLEDAWGAPVYDNYGTHEVGLIGYECQQQNGLHVNDDTAVLQITDRETGRALPDGAAGNIVVTSLHRSVPPIIRYNLKDLMYREPREKCACGARTTKLSGFLGRSDEMVKLRATSVYPRAAQDTVQGDERATGEFICVVENVGTGLSARERMTVRVEAKPEVDEGLLRASLLARLADLFGVAVDVDIVPGGSLAPLTGLGGEGKVKRLLDLR
ncbi:phenylacetate--CoA ligase family protein [Subtercola frigoramans]|uniref:Phenylacetate-CoA ligase n=1 Tax=Subtercola frigoramans TaxID=120298 RepID=A0ABS2L732_9MICO|nr:phenylacetate--CoA ligase family protein [Subtercola frigoramans]MBM7472877.1 phenylacetate-CoA ligase [Subtercola frigoramans]